MEAATSRTLDGFAPEYSKYLDLSEIVFFDHYGKCGCMCECATFLVRCEGYCSAAGPTLNSSWVTVFLLFVCTYLYVVALTHVYWCLYNNLVGCKCHVNNHLH